MASVDEVVAAVRGLADRRTGADMDRVYGMQCVDLINFVTVNFFGIFIQGNAIDLLDSAKAKGLTVIYNAPGVNPKKGDLVVMSVPYHKFGHVFVCIEDSDGYTIKTVEQNIDTDTTLDYQLTYGGIAKYNQRSFDGVIGWIRPPYSSSKGGNKMGVKIVNGDLFSSVITDVDPNIMNFNNDRKKIDRIVIHHNAGTNDAGARSTWHIDGPAGTSAHYQVANSKCWGCVGEESVAFHAGNYPMNQRSIGIEHLNNTGAPLWTISEETYKKSAELIHEICTRRGIPIDRQHILKHGEVAATSCPGGINIDRLINMAKNYGKTPTSNVDAVKKMIANNKPQVVVRNVDFKKGTFTAVVTNIASDYPVEIPTWTSDGGQDDLVWYKARRVGNDYVVDINVSKHKGGRGVYNIHGYVKDSTGARHFLGGTRFNMTQKQSGILTILAVNPADHKIEVMLSNITSSNAVSSVEFPTWSNPNGQDDLVWYKANKAGEGCYKAVIDTSKHKNPEGPFTIHAYLRLTSGTLVFVAGDVYSVKDPTGPNPKPKIVLYSPTDVDVEVRKMSQDQIK